MAQSAKGKLNFRCPSCFMRDIDIDMFYDKDKKEYYCIRCCYHGDEKDVLEKIKEETCETLQAMESGDEEHVDEELGDLLFAVVNLIRFRKRADSEELLRKASLKFESRFRAVEQQVRKSGRTWEDFSIDELEELWQKAKKES